MFDRPRRSFSQAVARTTGAWLAFGVSPAWASRFASGLGEVLDLGALSALAGLCGLVAVVVGRSRFGLLAGSCLAAWVARECVLVGEGGSGTGALPRSASLANLAALAALLGYVAGWCVARWPRVQRPLVVGALVLTVALLIAASVEPVVALLLLPLPAAVVPLAVGVGLRGAIERLCASPAVRRWTAQAWLAVCRLSSWTARAISGAVQPALRFVQRSRARRAWLFAVAAYLAGMGAAFTRGESSLAILRWAMEPGRVLHSMLAASVQTLPEAPIAWLVYGPVAAVLFGAASLALPTACARPGAVTSSAAE